MGNKKAGEKHCNKKGGIICDKRWARTNVLPLCLCSALINLKGFFPRLILTVFSLLLLYKQ